MKLSQYLDPHLSLYLMGCFTHDSPRASSRPPLTDEDHIHVNRAARTFWHEKALEKRMRYKPDATLWARRSFRQTSTS